MCYNSPMPTLPKPEPIPAEHLGALFKAAMFEPTAEVVAGSQDPDGILAAHALAHGRIVVRGRGYTLVFSPNATRALSGRGRPAADWDWPIGWYVPVPVRDARHTRRRAVYDQPAGGEPLKAIAQVTQAAERRGWQLAQIDCGKFVALIRVR